MIKKIGILNLMHDKIDTQKRFSYVLGQADPELEISYFYPRSHYRFRPLPPNWPAKPLDLDELSGLDGFIITGAPIEQLPFEEVDYWDELTQLFDRLKSLAIPQLYVCWGAMAAMHYFYGIGKHPLKEKLFGIYSQRILAPSPLLAGLANGFRAPHARYAEMNRAEILRNPRLTIHAQTPEGRLCLVSGPGRQSFLFSHLEYGPQAFSKEYQRELAARGGDDTGLAKPQCYFADESAMALPQFTWESTQEHFFKNWLQAVQQFQGGKNYVN
ncbi:homoserine O-succinyltransferase [Lactobacillus nasalidis]|uniref:Serine O-acetyltransferase n=1 Tax=Lactobacillus nasalidis TaxID=2797258 RepID=A0ABQ3W375_9LACO|nr:homoserine O-succinyltransferase [Lactobacillus nasalidis]GHV97012.1 homoserine O-succinyltransferase [Lactobacillus nasalidis]GHV99160.1 homoserine O-succinyltransferase [Lactobacillus nasalidis]GHW00671.1 homoserine O-succinyltransferase [Lactobacillus nasalidis]